MSHLGQVVPRRKPTKVSQAIRPRIHVQRRSTVFSQLSVNIVIQEGGMCHMGRTVPHGTPIGVSQAIQSWIRDRRPQNPSSLVFS